MAVNEIYAIDGTTDGTQNLGRITVNTGGPGYTFNFMDYFTRQILISSFTAYYCDRLDDNLSGIGGSGGGGSLTEPVSIESVNTDFTTAQNTSVTTTTEQLRTSDGTTATQGIYVLADTSNTDFVYVGPDDMTFDTNDDTDGWPLDPGAGLLIQVNDPSLIYVRANSGTQVVRYIVV